ncbi:MAG TPA: tetratricopeptide repeat protein [Streptosporangiaceae bacterium]|jgi:DNA-binding SARP family transcriptional activator/tetratricopeptide (TPR) repeat protein
MEFRTLGPVELWSAGHRRDLGPVRARSILASLLLAARTVVPAEVLIDRLWETCPPAKARESLSVYIARLRASLRQAVGDGARLTGQARAGYLLDVDPGTVDVHRFRALRGQADALAAAGDRARAVRLLREADGLWRGQALAGIPGIWAAGMRDALGEERRAAIARRAGWDLELGQPADLVGELRLLLASYPWDESLVTLQMTALYRAGRPADALSVYRETRSRLIEEQGTEPGAALTALHQRILERDPTLLPPDAPPAEAPPAATLPAGTSPPQTLPAETPPAGTLPAGTLPAGTLPAGTLPAGILPVGTLPAGILAAETPPAETPPVLDTLPAGVSPGPDTLPPDAAVFVGRDAELRLLTADHDGRPAIAVIQGMAGVGKTALAVRAARLVSARYPDGMLYLNLHSHDPGGGRLGPADALQRLLQMLSVPAAQIPETTGQRAALWRAQVARRRAVVILDDAAGHDQIRPLLPSGGGPGQKTPPSGRCLILITTRRRLADVGGTCSVSLDVLPTDEAVTLLRRIAGEALAGDAGQAAQAVRLCGRLPLAIQLTAGRLGRDGPADLASLVEELAQPPGWLGGTGAASPEVIAAFDLSYRALEAGHQRFFRRLGASPCVRVSLPTATALAGCTFAEAEKALATLLDYHLLARAPGGQYQFHDLIRGYATACAVRDDHEGERRQAVTRLLDYYLHMAEEADRMLHPARRRPRLQAGQLPVDIPAAAPGGRAPAPGRPARGSAVPAPGSAVPVLGTAEDTSAWLAAEWRSILEAARYAGRHEWKRQCADLTYLVAGFLEISACWEEAIAAHALALQASRDLGDPARIVRAALALSAARQQTGQHEAAIALAEEAAAICRSRADKRGEAEALDQLGLAHQRTARSREALAYFEEARIAYRTAEDPHGVAGTLSHSGIACWHLGRHTEAGEHLDAALAAYRQAGDRRGEAKVLNNLGKVRLGKGYHRDALDAYEKSLEIFREIGGAQNQAILHHNIGSVHHYKGSYPEALAACRRALAIYRETGDLPNEADVLNDIGAIYQSAACPDEALRQHQKALRIAEEVGDQSQQLIALQMIADIHRGEGRHGEALGHYASAMRLAREIGDQYEEGKILEGMAESALSTGRPGAARIAFRQALDIYQRLGAPEAASVRIRIETIDPGLAVRV